MEYVNIYYNLESFRIKKGLNKKELCEVVGIPYSTYLRKIKNPESFSIKEINKFKDFFGVESLERFLI